MLLESKGLRPGRLLNILQYTTHSLWTKNYLAPNANGAQAEKHRSAWQNKRTAELGYYRTSETKVMLTVKSEDRGSDSNQFRHYLKGSLQLGMTGAKFSQWHLSKFRSVIDYKRDVTVNFWKYHHGEQILYYAIKQNLKSLSEKACAKKNIGSPQYSITYFILLCVSLFKD